MTQNGLSSDESAKPQPEHLVMTGALGSTATTSEADLAAAVTTVRDQATAFARLPVGRKIALLRQVLGNMARVAGPWVREAARRKGLDPEGAHSGEEWLAGPVITTRNIRLLIRSLQALEDSGAPPLGRGLREIAGCDGPRLAVDVFPTSFIDTALFTGFSGQVYLQKDVKDAAAAKALQATFYQKRELAPDGQVAVILGAGNVASIPPLDTIYKMFVEGHTAILKMNPVNEYLGPFFIEALAPLIEAGYLRVVYGGAEVGRFLVEHPQVDDVHITGSDVTHDMIVWGPPGPERERRKRDNQPLLQKRISSELGNVSPVVIAPATYSEKELWFQARNVATMVGNNGSFNCNAAKVLVTSGGWAQRPRFLDLLRKALGELPLRRAYYPGAKARYESLLAGRVGIERFGAPREDQLAWALCTGLDASDKDERLFQVEPFCGLLSETTLPEGDPAAFLAAATRFCNDRLWGTLNAALIVPPAYQTGSVGAALQRATEELRYGTVAINHWPALCYGWCSPPWGGHPSATLANIQSGLGWVHNAYLLGGIEKSVIRGPLTVAPKPAWFYDNRMTHLIGERMVAMEANPGLAKLPGLVMTALKG